MAIQKTATVGNRLVLLSAFVHFSQFHQSQPYIKLCNMMNLRFFGENHKNLLTFTIIHILCTLKLPHKHSPLFFRSDDRLKFWRMPEHPEMSVDNQR